MKIAIVKYNAGNIESVRNALRRLGIQPVLTDKAEILQAADKVVFPGVGEASSAMNYLRNKKLDKAIKALKQPVLAICLGMQLLGNFSEENDTECLGIMPFNVRSFPQNTDFKVPHIGWNNISDLKSPLFNGIAEGSRVYFVHGYFVESAGNLPLPQAGKIATTSYGREFCAAAAFENFYAVQFHPEKSGRIGRRILKNFLNIKS